MPVGADDCYMSLVSHVQKLFQHVLHWIIMCILHSGCGGPSEEHQSVASGLLLDMCMIRPGMMQAAVDTDI